MVQFLDLPKNFLGLWVEIVVYWDKGQKSTIKVRGIELMKDWRDVDVCPHLVNEVLSRKPSTIVLWKANAFWKFILYFRITITQT